MQSEAAGTQRPDIGGSGSCFLRECPCRAAVVCEREFGSNQGHLAIRVEFDHFFIKGFFFLFQTRSPSKSPAGEKTGGGSEKAAGSEDFCERQEGGVGPGTTGKPGC